MHVKNKVKSAAQDRAHRGNTNLTETRVLLPIHFWPIAGIRPKMGSEELVISCAAQDALKGLMQERNLGLNLSLEV